MAVNGRTKVCGLIGYPVEHTLSPVIHNTLSELLGIDLIYVPLPVEPEKLEAAVRGASAFGFYGMNVTVPYKTRVMEYLQELDPAAAEIGAVNTLVPTPTGYAGYNTDMPGLKRAMESDGIALKGGNVLLLGAGGVARAAAVVCGVSQVSSLYIMNRTQDSARKLADELQQYYPDLKIQVLTYDEIDSLPDQDLIAIQCTNVGLFPEVDSVVLDDPDLYRRISVGYDLIFNPSVTRFMKLVSGHGGRAYNGLKMLLFQGIIAFELWNKVSVSQETAMQVYKILKKEAGIDE